MYLLLLLSHGNTHLEIIPFNSAGVQIIDLSLGCMRTGSSGSSSRIVKALERDQELCAYKVKHNVTSINSGHARIRTSHAECIKDRP